MGLHNVSELDEQTVFNLARGYKTACETIGKDVLSASPEEKKKAKNNALPWIPYFEALTDDELWRLMKECAEKRDTICAEYRKGWEEALDQFDPACAHELRAYLGDSYFGDVFYDFSIGKDGGLSIILDDNKAFSRKLVLEDVKWVGGAPKAIHPEAELVTFAPDAENGGFALTLRILETRELEEGGIDEEGNIYSARFSSAHIEKKCYNAVMSFVMNPFYSHLSYNGNSYIVDTFSALCADIVRKAQSCPDLTNEKELSLVPLCMEAVRLGGNRLPDDASSGFPLISALARDHGAEDIVPLIEQLENAGESLKRRRQKLTLRLFDAKYEPFVRALFEKVCDTQKGYPQKRPISEDRIRIVTDRLHDAGFAGEYPLFSKRGAVSGSSFETGIDGKRHKVEGGDAVVFVCCFGSVIDGFPAFMSGTCVTAEGGSQDVDLISCFFKDKNRRICRITELNITKDIQTDDSVLIRLTDIAAKRAELKKLDKEEVDLTGGSTDSGMRHVFVSAFAHAMLFVGVYLVGVLLAGVIGAICGLLSALLTWDFSSFVGLFEMYWKEMLILPAVIITAFFIIHSIKDRFGRG